MTGVGAPGAPPAPCSLCWDQRREEKDVLEAGSRARPPSAGWWSLSILVGPLPLHLGWVHPNPPVSCRGVGLLPPSLPGGVGTLLRLCCSCLVF